MLVPCLNAVIFFLSIDVGRASGTPFATQTKPVCSTSFKDGKDANFTLPKPPRHADLTPTSEDIRRSSFADGTFNITVPGTYILREDIELDMPETPSLDHPFQHGFVIGIAITVSNVTLNLNGHTIKMSRAFANRARFFNIIELAQQVFPPGIAGYKSRLVTANDVIIENGFIGLTSHAAIHGNNNERIIIRDLIIRDFEVAGIAINNGNDILVERVIIDNKNMEAPVHSNFALTWNLDRTLHRLIESGTLKKDDQNKAIKFRNDDDLRHILQNPGNDRFGFTKNEGNKPEGAVYGIYFSNEFSVLGLGRDNKMQANIQVKNVLVRNIANGPHSKVIFSLPEGESTANVLGYVFQWGLLFDENGKQLGLTTDVNALKFKIMKMDLWAAAHHNEESTKLKEGHVLFRVLKDMEKNALRAAADYDLTSSIGGDSRGHTTKGAFGMRFEGLRNVRVDNCEISGITNDEKRLQHASATTVSNGEFPHVWRGKESDKTYKGNFAYGLSCGSCESVYLKQIDITHVQSATGSAFGVAFIRDLSTVIMRKVRISNITVSNEGFGASANNIGPKAMEIFADKNAKFIKFEDTAHMVHSPPDKACSAESRTRLCLGQEPEPQCIASSVVKPAVRPTLLPTWSIFVVAFMLVTCACFAASFIVIRVRSFLKSDLHNKQERRCLQDSADPPAKMRSREPRENAALPSSQGSTRSFPTEAHLRSRSSKNQ